MMLMLLEATSFQMLSFSEKRWRFAETNLESMLFDMLRHYFLLRTFTRMFNLISRDQMEAEHILRLLR